MRPPLLLAAHGTRDQAGVAAFTALAERVAALAAPTRVAGGFIELSPPPLRDAVATLAGTDLHLVAVPLMLVAASHAKGDIPAALARERTRHPGLRWTYARPLGPHPALLDLLAARIGAVAQDPAPAVLVVGRGTSDPDANAEVAKTARLLWEGRSYPFTETAFVSLTRPSVAEGLDDAACSAPGRSWWPGISCFPGCCPTGLPARPATSPPHTPDSTSGAPTYSATAMRSPRWSTSAITRRWPEIFG